MDLFEHQAKELFARHGVAVPRGRVAWSPGEAQEVAAELGGTVVVKAQVQVGGRGKAGGIQLARDPAEARAQAERIIGMDIKGHVVRRVLVEEASDVAAEYYASILHDRAGKGFLAMASTQGGVDIEEVAARSPEAIVKVPVNPLIGLRSYHVSQLLYGAGVAPAAHKGAAESLGRLYQVLLVGNGAGLVMSTLDVVAQAGGRAANFLDVGGGASAETMASGLEVILSDRKVRSVLVNIFGGITRGDLVAEGILEALERLGDKVQVPLVVRLDGTNAEEGRELLAKSRSDKVVTAATMLEAAARAVELAGKEGI